MNANLTGNNDIAFYLGAKDQPFRRIESAYDADGYSRFIRRNSEIQEKGYYADQWSGSIFSGIVASLSHGRYLAGWTEGEGMYSVLSREVYTDKNEAAYAADENARIAAEREIEYQEKDQMEQAEIDAMERKQ